jgi:hypothetical protein
MHMGWEGGNADEKDREGHVRNLWGCLCELACACQQCCGSRDVTMLNPICRVFLHLRQNISHYFRRIVGSLFRSRDVDGDIAELWPAEGVVHVIFAKVVFREIGDVCLLDVWNVR